MEIFNWNGIISNVFGFFFSYNNPILSSTIKTNRYGRTDVGIVEYASAILKATCSCERHILVRTNVVRQLLKSIKSVN